MKKCLELDGESTKEFKQKISIKTLTSLKKKYQLEDIFPNTRLFILCQNFVLWISFPSEISVLKSFQFYSFDFEFFDIFILTEMNNLNYRGYKIYLSVW